MAETTLTRYLKLRLAANLSADARYNLQRIDALGATFITDATANLQVRSTSDIVIEPESPDIGGLPTVLSPGTVTVGTPTHAVNTAFYASNFWLKYLSSTSSKPALSLANSATTYLALQAATDTNDRTLTLGVSNGNQSVTFPATGDVLIADAVQTLTNKTIDGDDNTLTDISISSLKSDNTSSNMVILRDGSGNVISSLLTNSNVSPVAGISYSKLSLSNSIVNADINAAAGIVDSKLDTISTPGKVLGNAIISGTIGGSTSVLTSGTITASSVTATTLSGLLAGNQIIGDISGNAANVNGVVAIANGGTGKSTAVEARAALLPSYTGNELGTLRVKSDGSDVEWIAGAGLGTVTSVDLSMPAEFTVTNNPVTTAGTLTVSKASQSPNLVYASPDSLAGLPTFRSLVATDIPTISQSQVTGLGTALTNLTAVTATWLPGDGAIKTISHSFNKTAVSVTIYDENGEDIFVDTVDRVSNSSISLTSSVSPTGSWTVIIRP